MRQFRVIKNVNFLVNEEFGESLLKAYLRYITKPVSTVTVPEVIEISEEESRPYVFFGSKEDVNEMIQLLDIEGVDYDVIWRPTPTDLGDVSLDQVTGLLTIGGTVVDLSSLQNEDVSFDPATAILSIGEKTADLSALLDNAEATVTYNPELQVITVDGTEVDLSALLDDVSVVYYPDTSILSIQGHDVNLSTLLDDTEAVVTYNPEIGELQIDSVTVDLSGLADNTLSASFASGTNILTIGNVDIDLSSLSSLGTLTYPVTKGSAVSGQPIFGRLTHGFSSYQYADSSPSSNEQVQMTPAGGLSDGDGHTEVSTDKRTGYTLSCVYNQEEGVDTLKVSITHSLWSVAPETDTVNTMLDSGTSMTCKPAIKVDDRGYVHVAYFYAHTDGSERRRYIKSDVPYPGMDGAVTTFTAVIDDVSAVVTNQSIAIDYHCYFMDFPSPAFLDGDLSMVVIKRYATRPISVAYHGLTAAETLFAEVHALMMNVYGNIFDTGAFGNTIHILAPSVDAAGDEDGSMIYTIHLRDGLLIPNFTLGISDGAFTERMTVNKKTGEVIVGRIRDATTMELDRYTEVNFKLVHERVDYIKSYTTGFLSAVGHHFDLDWDGQKLAILVTLDVVDLTDQELIQVTTGDQAIFPLVRQVFHTTGLPLAANWTRIECDDDGAMVKTVTYGFGSPVSLALHGRSVVVNKEAFAGVANASNESLVSTFEYTPKGRQTPDLFSGLVPSGPVFISQDRWYITQVQEPGCVEIGYAISSTSILLK